MKNKYPTFDRHNISLEIRTEEDCNIKRHDLLALSFDALRSGSVLIETDKGNFVFSKCDA